MSNESTVLSQLDRIQKLDPALYNSLYLAYQDLYKVFYSVFPPKAVSTAAGGVVTLLDAVTNFNISTTANNVNLTWNPVNDAFSYEIRLGATWETAIHVVTTVAIAANVDPRILNLVYGNYTFLIKARTSSNLEGTGPTSVTLSVPQIGAPNLTGQVITNNILLSWTIPTSLWAIDYYAILKDGVTIGHVKGTFTIIQELTAGSRDYQIEAVDIVGNVGSPSSVATLSSLDPDNFLNLATVNAAYSGTYSNTRNVNYAGLNGIMGAIVIETWENHFINNSWTTIQDQINAGFPKYNQPTNTNGYYQEIFDLGAIYSNATITGLFEQITLAGDVTVTIQVAGSTDNITYSSFISGPAVFFASIRYAKIKYIFTNLNNTSYCFIYNVRARLDIQLTLDSGNATATSTDVGGTTISFTKSFQQVNSVTVGVNSASPRFVVFQNVTTTGFDVLVFNATGTRVTEVVNWKARGVI